MRLIWTEPALQDLRELRAYIAHESPGAAERPVALILATADNLLSFPDMGRLGRRRGTREMVVARTPYVLVYRRRAREIGLLRVIHGRRQWPQSP